jgi:hypothetical protein
MPQGEGWRFFAGTMLGLAGLMRLFDAIWFWRYNGPVPDNLQNAILGSNLNTYGWVYMIVGIILIASSFGVVFGSDVSRWVGILAAGILSVTSIWSIPYYPVWSITYIGIGILVIYGLSVYGGRKAYDGD